jgi:hypothetical protein
VNRSFPRRQRHVTEPGGGFPLRGEGDAPESRAVHGPKVGGVTELPVVGGLHHRDVREAA